MWLILDYESRVLLALPAHFHLPITFGPFGVRFARIQGKHSGRLLGVGLIAAWFR
jgi:hypothetical protein